MSRVLLLLPPAPFPTGGPSLSLSYLAASLLQAGHEVQVLDLSARFGPDQAAAGALVERWQPALVGVSLLTETARAAYQLLARLPRTGARSIAGGPHASAVPLEPLRHGFSLVALGEAESTLVELADALDAEQRGIPFAPQAIPGLVGLRDDGRPWAGPARPRLVALDRLPPPDRAASLFDRRWYLPGGQGALPRALLSSRGCPGRCTFCASRVGGRTSRLHSVARVLAELHASRPGDELGVCSFHDDAFTADRPRLLALCRRIAGEFTPPLRWWCESRVDHFDAEVADALAAAGCLAVAFGVESGDAALLRRIGKGITPEQAVAAFTAARAAGLLTTANLMFGFPGEGLAELAATRALIERLAPLTDSFSPLGLLLPYPGTAIYRRHARAHGFAGWWLDPRRLAILHGPLADGGGGSPAADGGWPARRAALEQAALDADFFQYSGEVRREIEACLALRRAHEAARLARLGVGDGGR